MKKIITILCLFVLACTSSRKTQQAHIVTADSSRKVIVENTRDTITARQDLSLHGVTYDVYYENPDTTFFTPYTGPFKPPSVPYSIAGMIPEHSKITRIQLHIDSISSVASVSAGHAIAKTVDSTAHTNVVSDTKSTETTYSKAWMIWIVVAAAVVLFLFIYKNLKK